MHIGSNQKTTAGYPLFVRWLHAGVAAGALFQLATSLAVIPEETELLMDVHALISNLLWVYVIGHVGMVWAHVRAGDPVIQRVSPFHYKPIVTNSNELMGFTKKKEQDG